MKNLTTQLITVLLFLNIHAQEIPYNTTPDWESTPLGHVATGLGLADINGDGWKDIVAANGNDIQRQNLVVYYNNGDGTFPDSPSWSSSDIDYHGHCAVGDINKDGWMDVAVSVYIGPAGFSEPGKVKVYYNQGGELESIPSFESVSFYNFSCALGDADSDGDLDLAVAASESYGGIWDYGKVFLNNNGLFDTEPDWESSNLMGAMDVEFADMDNNGFNDLIFIGNEHPGCIFLADNNGQIDVFPDWQSSEPATYNNSIDIGFFGTEQTPGFATTGNDQLGGDGKVRFYTFSEGVPVNSAASWLSPVVGYGSGIFLADVSRDGNLDLIYGGWWQPMEIIKGTGTSFENQVTYTSATSSVVEAIQLADLGREAVVPMYDTLTIFPDQSTSIRLKFQVIENILTIYKNGLEMLVSDYCYVPNRNMISFAQPLSTLDVIVVHYEVSADPDIVITNWDGTRGNFIYYNNNISTGLQPSSQLTETPVIYPNPATSWFCIKGGRNVSGIVIFDRMGREVLKEKISSVDTDLKVGISNLNTGMYFIKLKSERGDIIKKLIVE